jgi:hypothetical protein
LVAVGFSSKISDNTVYTVETVFSDSLRARIKDKEENKEEQEE